MEKEIKTEEISEKKEVQPKKKEEKEFDTKKSIFKLVFNIVFWTCLIGLAIIWIIEVVLIKDDKEPIFCLSKEVHEVDGGTVEQCNGLGYKIFKYDTDSINGTEFGPFFTKMREE